RSFPDPGRLARPVKPLAGEGPPPWPAADRTAPTAGQAAPGRTETARIALAKAGPFPRAKGAPDRERAGAGRRGSRAAPEGRQPLAWGVSPRTFADERRLSPGGATESTGARGPLPPLRGSKLSLPLCVPGAGAPG